MIARRLGTALAGLTLAGSGVYLFVYLYRWEWNRALIAGVFLLAAQMALSTTAILARLKALEAARAADAPRVPRAARHGRPPVLARLQESAPPRRDHFAWMQPGADRMGVFVPILMGAGFVLSGLAWLVERVARRTAGPALERGLADRLSVFSLPEQGLVPAPVSRDDGRLVLLLGPGGTRP
ncbi:MAG: hypothetical protein ACRD0N_13570 [Acidimicrobiales bacterium]